MDRLVPALVAPLRRLARPLLALALLAGAVAAPAPAAAYESVRVRWYESYRGLWLGFHAGVSFGSSVSVDDATLPDSDATDPMFGLALHYRLRRFDLGLVIDNIGGGAFQGFDSDRPVGGMSRVAAMLRWRYLDEPWGGLYMRLSPGWMALSHSDHIRAEIARAAGRDNPNQLSDLEGIDTYNSAFTLGIDFGVLIHLWEGVAAFAELETVTASTTLRVDGQDIDYNLVVPIFALGIETRL